MSVSILLTSVFSCTFIKGWSFNVVIRLIPIPYYCIHDLCQNPKQNFINPQKLVNFIYITKKKKLNVKKKKRKEVRIKQKSPEISVYIHFCCQILLKYKFDDWLYKNVVFCGHNLFLHDLMCNLWYGNTI